jgi:hypothetical protein
LKINSLGELKRLIALCRKTGVTAIEIDGIKLQLGGYQPISSIQAPILPDYSGDIPEANIQVPQYTPMPDKYESDALSPDQLLFYSSTEQTEEATN